MKKITKCFDVSKFLIITLIVLFAFSTTSCPDGGGNGVGGNGNKTDNTNNNPSGTSPFLGDALSFSGQVYLEKWDKDELFVRYSNFNGNPAIADYYGGNGKITNGNLSYSIGIPTDLRTLYLEYMFDVDYDDFNYSRDVRGVNLFCLPIDSWDYSNLYRDNTTTIERNNYYSYTYELVEYLYVDNDVTINGTGWKLGPETEIEDGIRITYILTLGDLNLALKAGWNAVYYKETETITITGSASANITLTYDISLNNPSNLKWTIIDYDNEYYSLTLDKSKVSETGNLHSLKPSRRIRLNRLLSIQE
jgi:hypothetical protein